MTEIKTFNSIQEFITYRDALGQDTRVGFVPTMGALHQGHASLIRKASDENDICVLSIYVNPTQFNNAEDLQKYPKTWDADIELARANGAHIVIAPQYGEIYADGYRYKVMETDFSKQLCGAHRAGHFDGVLTVVMKLLQIVQPHKAYFGEKDYQQLQLIRDMTKTFFLRTEIIGLPTIREQDGLAMSSRNTRLSEEGRKKAPLIYKALTESRDPQVVRQTLQAAGVEVEYLEDHGQRRFIAAFIDNVRLIDNVAI
ncbi:pantoate--beta-alanine ligase [Pseudobdellovibrio exovorus]|uniref:Pantothenate synthetase n=1 Tax=Pseudobdellovibrio exovorus JSS TaxID=1184267 RepID=M4VBB0_9BACT|nr:pantoate--beta-alanine ligase [Pseudobdellovibrio exovorus]AGH96478.1 pantothenate synthetase [Pseudobdellovibrio exovorus JSS]